MRIATVVLALALAGETALAQVIKQPGWQPHWFVELSGNVLSPGGVDKNQFGTSLGVGLSVVYWINWDTQLMASAMYSPLKTEPYNWLDSIPTGASLYNLDVKADLRIFSLEARKLFPSDRKNFLSIGLGVDYFHFGTVTGNYLEQPAGTGTSLIPRNFSKKRDPPWAAGVHVSPGLFFLLYPQISVDIAIRFHLLYDSKHTFTWIEPTFGMGYRIH